MLTRFEAAWPSSEIASRRYGGSGFSCSSSSSSVGGGGGALRALGERRVDRERDRQRERGVQLIAVGRRVAELRTARSPLPASIVKLGSEGVCVPPCTSIVRLASRESR